LTTIGVAPLIKDIEFGGLIADKAFDSNWIIEDMNERKAKIVISQHPRRAKPLDIDTGHLQMAPPDREFLRQTERIQTHSNAIDKTDSSFRSR